MPYAMLYEFFPKIAEEETRSLTLLTPSDLGLPADEYAFVEMFCDERGCDCRRVFFYVQAKKHGNVATIAYGWESREFYVKWLGVDDKETIDDLMGPCLNLASPQSKFASGVLKIVKNILLADGAYVERIKRHYRMVREQVDKSVNVGHSELNKSRQGDVHGNVVSFPGTFNAAPYINQSRNIGRNDPCPCGSGKKHKQCCL